MKGWGVIMRGREDEGTDMRQRGARGGEAERGKQKARRSRQTQRDRGGKKEKERMIARGSFLHT